MTIINDLLGFKTCLIFLNFPLLLTSSSLSSNGGGMLRKRPLLSGDDLAQSLSSDWSGLFVSIRVI